MKKQFFRVKQIADQTFLRAEKTDALTEDLLAAEKRVDSIKTCCQTTHKKIASCHIDFGSEISIEKRLKKIPQVLLGMSMLENGNGFPKSSVLGTTLRDCSSIQTKIGTDLLEYCTEVEKLILKPITGILENDLHNISKLRKQLGKLVLDMDSARTRLQTAEKQQQSSTTNLNAVGKVDTLKEEMDDASMKVEQCRDSLATELFSLVSREPQLAQLLVQYHELQASYYRNALSHLEDALPALHALLDDFPQKPVYGCSLKEHLRVTGREVAHVIDTCVTFLIEYAIEEEGLLRITGSASKLKKVKSAFDANVQLDLADYLHDPHVISGALKSYLRELPEPLMTCALYNDWMNAAKMTDFQGRLQAIWQVLHSLPKPNYNNLKCVIEFLSKIQENSEINKMSSQNIAIVMAPNLIWPLAEDITAMGMNMSTTSLHTAIVDLLIIYSDWFFAEKIEQAPNFHQVEEVDEVNGNNLHVSSRTNEPPPSPRSPHKAQKKPPPPPPHKDIVDLVPAEELSLKDTARPSVEIPCTRPIVPKKPSYSSCSLDRRSKRSSDLVTRPTVPPPDRPSTQLSASTEDLVASGDDTRTESPKHAAIQHSRSFSQMNRFDFLLNQGGTEPPSRPPRTTSDGTEKVKPLRPQPPAKPRIAQHTENTNL